LREPTQQLAEGTLSNFCFVLRFVTLDRHLIANKLRK